ncbi:DUF5693 family protein [Cellulosilyticum sp. I15G10I2]|uniref:DUF5693 family protein n=1 Tax=Cellulosilyticum sp. I15G10I2 TaxID=1892843 RepID=UPI00085BFB0A|nr:DUF5693 family protein [Cellulosilyticum sp. I15G10I2]
MKKQIRMILNILITISVIACLVVGFFRVRAEEAYKNVQIAIRYTDVLNISEQTQTSIQDVLLEFKEAGATTLFVRENTVLPASRGELSNYKEQGEVTVFEGYLVKAFYKDITDIKPQLNYIVTTNANIWETIYKDLSLKNVPVRSFVSEDAYFVEVGDFSNVLASIGVGFNTEDLKVAADLGYVISPQIRGWGEPSEASIEYLIDMLQEVAGVGAIYFSDSEIPGATSPLMINYIGEHQLGFVEFFSNKQKGFGLLAKQSSQQGQDFRVTRLHTLTDDEVRKYGPKEVLDRYGLALRERNLRTFLFKMPNTMNLQKDMQDLKVNIRNFKDMAEKEGYIITEELQNYNLKPGNYLLSVLAGIAAIAVFVLLLDLVGLRRLGYLLGIIGFIGYAGLLKLSPSFGLKMMALFGAIIFPTYAVSTAIDSEPKNMGQTLTAFLKVCFIAFGGALTIIGTISRTSFGLGIDVFAGVKIAHIIPIILILAITFYKKHGLDISYIKKLLTSKVTYLAVAVIGIVGIALLIYTTRTGNGGSVSSLELQVRQLLDNILGVRPRTKEFLIGYPILIALIAFGYKEKYLPFLIFAAIGPVSLVNTYAHIHTPVLISLIRSGYGIVIGFIIGAIMIYILKLLIKVVKKWGIQIK